MKIQPLLPKISSLLPHLYDLLTTITSVLSSHLPLFVLSPLTDLLIPQISGHHLLQSYPLMLAVLSPIFMP